MTIARTQVLPSLKAPIGVPDAHCVEGMVVHFEDFTVTASSDTTAAMFMGGLIPRRIMNQSGAPATFTFYDARALNGTALNCYDYDQQLVETFTVPDGGSQELEGVGLNGLTWCVIVAAVAASGITMVCTP